MRYRTPWGRLYHASLYSLKGLRCAFRQEQAFEYEAVVFLVICATALSASLPPFQALALLGAWLAVMALELVNGAVERAFDLIDPQFRPEIGAGKDMLSAAVFIMVCFNVLLWAAVAAEHCGLL